jgi:hypothetical protein
VANGLGGRWGSIYSPHSIITIGGGGQFTGLVRYNSLESGEVGLVWSTEQVQWSPLEVSERYLEAGQGMNKSGEATGQVRWGSLEANQSFLEAGQGSDMSGPPDNSSGGTGLVW